MLSIGCLNDNCILACYDDFFIHKMSVRIYRYCFADPAGRRSGGQFITEAFQRFRRRLGGDYFCLGICRHVRADRDDKAAAWHHVSGDSDGLCGQSDGDVFNNPRRLCTAYRDRCIQWNETSVPASAATRYGWPRRYRGRKSLLS